MSRDNLGKALTDILDEEIEEYCKVEIGSAYHFSCHYNDRKKQILSSTVMLPNAVEQDRYYFDARRRYGHSSRGRRIAMLVAVLIMVLTMTAAAIAIVKPHIYYVIKETLTSWDITYDRGTGKSGDVKQKEVFKRIVPVTPEGYTIVNREEDPNSFSIDYEDNDGHRIYYTQFLPGGLMSSIDTERHKIHVEKIKECEVIMAISDKDVLTTFANSDYVFEIGGNCDKEVINVMIEDILSEPQ